MPVSGRPASVFWPLTAPCARGSRAWEIVLDIISNIPNGYGNKANYYNILMEWCWWG
jgi:hypothetical protein